jgi:hypothetical protein
MDRQKRHDEDGDDNQRVHGLVAERFGSPRDKGRRLGPTILGVPSILTSNSIQFSI